MGRIVAPAEETRGSLLRDWDYLSSSPNSSRIYRFADEEEIDRHAGSFGAHVCIE